MLRERTPARASLLERRGEKKIGQDRRAPPGISPTRPGEAPRHGRAYRELFALLRTHRKGDLTDAGHHMPFIASWPGKIEAGSSCGELICFSDMMATIAALLDILRITKQSLNRVLKQLLEAGFVEARAGVVDRRQRLLYLTPQGAKLARDLAALQSARFLKVMDELPAAARGAASEFLFAMIDSEERERVRAHLACAKSAGGAL